MISYENWKQSVNSENENDATYGYIWGGDWNLTEANTAKSVVSNMVRKIPLLFKQTKLWTNSKID